MPQTDHPRQLSAGTAETWLNLALDNIELEYPHYAWIVANSPDDYALHRDKHPTFFGSFDWHSCVEMYWVAVRILRLYPGLPSEQRAIALINELLTLENIAIETAFCANNPGFERPYGWGWVLKLQHELDRWDNLRASAWRENLRPLATQLVSQFQAWLPKLTYPQRFGMHPNTAFALNLSLPYSHRYAPDLAELIASRALDWFAADVTYPFSYEPNGADFLSGGLTEAVLMSHVLAEDEFPRWIDRYLPESEIVFISPAVVSDPSDGQIAHLHGLNLSRAWALGELAAVLPGRRESLLAMREEHIAASIDVVAGSHYMVEHWVVAYALLLFTEPD